MSNIQHIIEEQPSNIGNFMVGRLLPFKGKRMVGPFSFIDHMGPACLSDLENLDVGPHPHIGLSTLTYLLEGSMLHRDSLGTELEIQPGAVNWMTAGRGIVHSERTPDYLRNSEKMLHGLQIWVALPLHLEDMEPAFSHTPAAELPTWQEDGLTFKLIAGQALGRTSPVPVYSPLYFLEIKSTHRQTVTIGAGLYGESGLYILQGGVESEGHVFHPKQMLVTQDSTLCSFEMLENTTVYLFGGEPFPEERFIYWNFVASSRARIEDAKDRWLAQTFPPVPGETDFVPLPAQPVALKN